MSAEGDALERRVFRVRDRLEKSPDVSAALSLPTTWIELAQRIFPNSHSLTREERREFDARVWADLEPIDFAE